MSGYSPHPGSWGTRTRVELVDEEAGELVLSNKMKGALKVIRTLCRKPTDDVCCYGDARNTAQAGGIVTLTLIFIY